MLLIGGSTRAGSTTTAVLRTARELAGGDAVLHEELAALPAFDPDDDRDPLPPAVERLRSGVSILIAPEGTRSPTPSPGPFKKGAFHLAMQAGVPVVPLVFRNTGELCGRNALVIHPGVVQVAVLEPIDVSAWDPAALDEHVEDVAYVGRAWPKDLLDELDEVFRDHFVIEKWETVAGFLTDTAEYHASFNAYRGKVLDVVEKFVNQGENSSLLPSTAARAAFVLRSDDANLPGRPWDAERGRHTQLGASLRAAKRSGWA